MALAPIHLIPPDIPNLAFPDTSKVYLLSFLTLEVSAFSFRNAGLEDLNAPAVNSHLHKNIEGEVSYQDIFDVVAQVFISKKCSLLLGFSQQ